MGLFGVLVHHLSLLWPATARLLMSCLTYVVTKLRDFAVRLFADFSMKVLGLEHGAVNLTAL